jgi:hypothetical protein
VISAVIGLTTDEAVAIGTLALAAVGALTFIANLFVVRAARTQAEATRLAADATLREAKQVAQQVRTAEKQADVAERQLRAITRQVQVAERALRFQSIPRLIPAGMEACRIGKREAAEREPKIQVVKPVFLGVINAGDGAAVFNVDAASATCGEDGGKGPMGINVPPALAAGGQGTIRLTPQIGEVQEVAAGMIYTVSIDYHAYGAEEQIWNLTFTAQIFRKDHWEIQVQEGSST